MIKNLNLKGNYIQWGKKIIQTKTYEENIAQTDKVLYG
jgi:hypothetical protein